MSRAEIGNDVKCSTEVKFIGTAWWLNGETLTEVQIQFKYQTHIAQYQIYLTKYQMHSPNAKYQTQSPNTNQVPGHPAAEINGDE